MISLIIPAYNEQDVVAQTVKQSEAILTEHGLQPFEILVVDDGSTDQTGVLAEQSGATVIHHPHNLGYGRSLKDGIAQARYDTIVITDADGTYPLDRIPDLVKEFQKGFHMVIGARKGAYLDSSLFKSLLRLFLKWLVEFTTGRKIPDINSGLRVFSKKDAMPFFPFVSNAFSFTTSLTLAYMMSSKFVTFMPISYHKRVGAAKVRLLRDSARTLQYITEAILFYNPIKLFLVLAGAVAGLAPLCFGAAYYFKMMGLVYAGFAALLTALVIMALGFLSIQFKEILHSFRRD